MTSSAYFHDQLSKLRQLAADLDPSYENVAAARRLLARFDYNPSLAAAPLARRHALYDIRRLIPRLTALQSAQQQSDAAGDPYELENSMKHASIPVLEAQLATLENEQRSLEAQRLQLHVNILQTKRNLHAARESLLHGSEPGDPAKLAQLVDQLQRRIKASPERSHTAQQAAALLQRISDDGDTTAAAIEAVQSTLRRYQRGLEVDDPIHHNFGAPPIAGRE